MANVKLIYKARCPRCNADLNIPDFKDKIYAANNGYEIVVIGTCKRCKKPSRLNYEFTGYGDNNGQS